MSNGRWVLVATCLGVTVLAVVLAVLEWDRANKLATSVSALAGVAAVGVAVWAVLARSSRAQVRVRDSGRAVATRGGRASTGVRSPASEPSDAIVEHSGDAEASDNGQASTGVDLT
ncbi:hypothetical protein GCM10023088_11240 [Actinomadura verrucosospora]